MWVNKEQCARARKYDVLSYLNQVNPSELVRVSRNEYCLKSHDSFRISNGKWHWWSRGKAGHTAVDYLVEVEGYSFPSAVAEVLKVMDGKAPLFMPKESPIFVLPPKAESNARAREYLISRGINEWLLDMLEVSGLFYEDRNYHNVVFVGRDYNDNPRHAYLRSTGNTSFKGNARGSDKRFCFALPFKSSRVVRVFECPIDLLSYVSLCIMKRAEWQFDDMITLCGVNSRGPLEEYIKANPKMEQIYLHFDNDEAGVNAAHEIKEKYGEQYEVILKSPEFGKDYNEMLMKTMKGNDDE